MRLAIRLFLGLRLVAGLAYAQIPDPVGPPGPIGPPGPGENALALGSPGGNCTLIDKGAFVICHSAEWREPRWVAYHLTRELLDGPGNRAKEQFYAEPALPRGRRAELADYRRSGYDRGHMVPASSLVRSQAAMHQTFSLANMVPQTPELNRDMWRKLEDSVRELTRAHGETWVVVGPLVAPQPLTIGPHRVAVPTHTWKIVYCNHESDPDGAGEPEAFGFLMPNRRETLAGDPNTYTWPIRTIEGLVGLNFHSARPDHEQDQIELPDSKLPPEALHWRPPAR